MLTMSADMTEIVCESISQLSQNICCDGIRKCYGKERSHFLHGSVHVTCSSCCVQPELIVRKQYYSVQIVSVVSVAVFTVSPGHGRVRKSTHS